jgi:hypothetical protein
MAATSRETRNLQIVPHICHQLTHCGLMFACRVVGVLALPVAEFLAVKHGTSYLGYSQHSSKGAAHPFFASRLHKHEQHGMRAIGADAADAADAEQAAGTDAAAAASPGGAGVEGLARTGSGAAPGSGRRQPPHSPHGRDLEASEDVPLITCSSSATLLEVRSWHGVLGCLSTELLSFGLHSNGHSACFVTSTACVNFNECMTLY